LQKALAKDITCRVHSKEDYDSAFRASQILFGKSTTDELASIDEKTLLSVFEGVPQTEIQWSVMESTRNVADFLSEDTKNLIFASKGEARRMIQGGGVSINKIKINSIDQKMDFELLQGKYLLVQKGKKNYYLLKIVS